MFDDILGKEEFFGGNENPIEFEYEPRPKTAKEKYDKEPPLHERLREFVDEWMKQYGDDYDAEGNPNPPEYIGGDGYDDEDCDEQCDNCAQTQPDYGKDDTKEAWGI